MASVFPAFLTLELGLQRFFDDIYESPRFITIIPFIGGDELKLPTEIKVGAVIYNVVNKSFIELDSDRNYQGLCDYPNTEIAILKDLSEERKKDVFFHELTHALLYEAGYDEQDEDMVNRVGKVLQQVIIDNDFSNLKQCIL